MYYGQQSVHNQEIKSSLFVIAGHSLFIRLVQRLPLPPLFIRAEIMTHGGKNKSENAKATERRALTSTIARVKVTYRFHGYTWLLAYVCNFLY